MQKTWLQPEFYFLFFKKIYEIEVSDHLMQAVLETVAKITHEKMKKNDTQGTK